MDSVKHDLQKDVGSTHAPPEGGSLDFQMLSASPMDGTGSAQSRRPPALTLEASRDRRQDSWNATPDRDRAAQDQAEPDGEVAGYRARMLAKVGGDQSRGIAFTDAELADFLSHAKGMGFGQEDIEAILIIKVRKPKVRLAGLKQVAECLARKREDRRIQLKEGYDFMKAYQEAQNVMLSGGRLDPKVYLNESFVESHTKDFSGTASYLMPGENYIEFVKDERKQYADLGYGGALYVSTKSEIDRVLAEANGNIAVVELLLGIPTGYWQNKGGLYRIDILNPEEKGLRLPDGGEANANEFWTPGAYTSGGAAEAVLDQVPKIEGNFVANRVIE